MNTYKLQHRIVSDEYYDIEPIGKYDINIILERLRKKEAYIECGLVYWDRGGEIRIMAQVRRSEVKEQKHWKLK